jgi:heat shock protein HslJ
MLRVFVAVIAFLVLACSSGKTAASSEAETLDGKWQLTAIEEDDQNIDIPYEAWKISMEFFSGEKKTVGIQTSCNSGSCGFESDQKSIKISNMCPMTKKACMGDRGEWEGRYMKMLSEVGEWTIQNGELSLSGANRVLKFKRL